MTTAPLQINDLSFAYNIADPPFLQIPSLTLQAGQQLLITGPSGCGKSTLLHLIAGLMDPIDGDVLVDGTNIHSLKGASRDRLRGRNIGMIFQSFNLLSGFSALENVMAALLFSSEPPRDHKKHATELLNDLGIDRVQAMPDQLSIGQQQRVAVARAIVTRPKIVLADEPTASLDPAAAATAISLIKETCASRKSALLCVSHDPQVIEHFDHCNTFASLARGREERVEI